MNALDIGTNRLSNPFLQEEARLLAEKEAKRAKKLEKKAKRSKQESGGDENVSLLSYRSIQSAVLSKVLYSRYSGTANAFRMAVVMGKPCEALVPSTGDF